MTLERFQDAPSAAAPSNNAALPRRWTGPMIPLPRGNRLAGWILGLFGWKVVGRSLPALQGVVMVYPHTSNWDFPIGLLSKWTMGFELKFWAKDSLFKLPLFGRWMRAVGGVPVNRRAANGLVGDTVAQMERARARGEQFWLIVAPEGTRSYTDSWKSGAYWVAVQAQVPVAVTAFDYATRTVVFTEFVELSGDPARDFALFAEVLKGRQGKHPDQAGPIRLRS